MPKMVATHTHTHIYAHARIHTHTQHSITAVMEMASVSSLVTGREGHTLADVVAAPLFSCTFPTFRVVTTSQM